MNCPYCGSNVREGDAHCAHCGAAIEWKGDEALFEDPGGFVEVYRAFDPAALPVIESLLTANRVPFIVANEVTQDFVGVGRLGGGYNVAFGPPVVKVPEGRAQEARELLAIADSAPVPDPEPEE